MIHSMAIQHRMKHFDQLLERELEFIRRGHEQNLVTYNKLEKSIHRESNQIQNLKRKKLPIGPMDEDSNPSSEKSPSTNLSTTIGDNDSLIDDKLSQIFPKYHRHCYKGQRLPPIVKFNRQKRTKNDLNWIARLQTDNEVFTLLEDELPRLPLPDLTPVQKRLHSFMETLPPTQSIQKGFDNFAGASMYTRRVRVAMK